MVLTACRVRTSQPDPELPNEGKRRFCQSLSCIFRITRAYPLFPLTSWQGRIGLCQFSPTKTRDCTVSFSFFTLHNQPHQAAMQALSFSPVLLCLALCVAVTLAFVTPSRDKLGLEALSAPPALLSEATLLGVCHQRDKENLTAQNLGSWASYKQCDSRWAGNQLGTCSQTVCQAGCAMSRYAVQIREKNTSQQSPLLLPLWLMLLFLFLFVCLLPVLPWCWQPKGAHKPPKLWTRGWRVTVGMRVDVSFTGALWTSWAALSSWEFSIPPTPRSAQVRANKMTPLVVPLSLYYCVLPVLPLLFLAFPPPPFSVFSFCQWPSFFLPFPLQAFPKDTAWWSTCAGVRTGSLWPDVMGTEITMSTTLALPALATLPTMFWPLQCTTKRSRGPGWQWNRENWEACPWVLLVATPFQFEP